MNQQSHVSPYSPVPSPDSSSLPNPSAGLHTPGTPERRVATLWGASGITTVGPFATLRINARKGGIDMRRTPTTTLTVLSASDARRHAEARVQYGDELLLLLDVTLMSAFSAYIDRRDSHAREDIGAVAGQIVSIQIERDRRAWRARYAHVMDRLEQDAA